MVYSKKKVLVVGIGKSGLSAARWLSNQGAEVVIADNKKEDEIDTDALRFAHHSGVRLETGGHREEIFTTSETIIVSPGVPLDLPQLQAADRKGIPIIGEMELAGSLIDVPIIAVTGTNGKSTVVSLIGEMIEAAGKNVFVGGNIGTPLMDYVNRGELVDFIVAEVSSFQLDSMKKFCPKIAILLNISPDHLDRYPDYDAYAKSKFRIFRNQRAGHYAILNDDDERISGFMPGEDVSVLRYGFERRENLNAYVNEETIMARLLNEQEHHFDTRKFHLPGRHNIENLMAVVLTGLLLDIESDLIRDCISNFKGLPNRIEFVGTVKGIEFYNDSKATNVDSAIRAIESFDRPVVLIAGGRHKGGDYSPLVMAAKRNVKKVILMGESKHRMSRAFEGAVPFVLAEDMDEAIALALECADRDDVVLLAPACSSFDMYRDYSHRGSVFRERIGKLKNGSEKKAI